MKKSDQKIIADLRSLFENAGGSAKIADLVSVLQDKFDEMGERAQEGDRGQALLEEIGNLETLQQCFDELDSAFGNFEF